MKGILKLALLGIFGLFLFNACDPDPIDPTNPGTPLDPPAVPQYPKLSLLDSTDVLFEDAALLPGDAFKLRLRGQKGDSLLSRLTVTANNEFLDPSRISVNGQTQAKSEYILEGTDRDTFVWEIDLVAQQEARKVIYEFTVIDLSGRSAVTDILINTNITPFTPPVISVLDEDPVTVLTDVPVIFDFVLEALGAPIEWIEIYQGSELVNFERIKFAGETITSNPFPLDEADQHGFSEELEIRGNNQAGLQGYTVTFIDSLQNKYYKEISFNAIRRVENITVTLEHDMALDIDAMRNYNYDKERADNEDNSDIRDIARVPGDWDRTIAAAHSREIRRVLPVQDVDFDAIVGENKVREAWLDASNFTNIVTEYDSSLVRGIDQKDSLIVDLDTIIQVDIDIIELQIDTIDIIVSEPLELNDLYIVQDRSAYYMLRVKAINDMDKNYTFEVKY